MQCVPIEKEVASSEARVTRQEGRKVLLLLLLLLNAEGASNGEK